MHRLRRPVYNGTFVLTLDNVDSMIRFEVHHGRQDAAGVSVQGLFGCFDARIDEITNAMYSRIRAPLRYSSDVQSKLRRRSQPASCDKATLLCSVRPWLETTQWLHLTMHANLMPSCTAFHATANGAVGSPLSDRCAPEHLAARSAQRPVRTSGSIRSIGHRVQPSVARLLSAIGMCH